MAALPGPEDVTHPVTTRYSFTVPRMHCFIRTLVKILFDLKGPYVDDTFNSFKVLHKTSREMVVNKWLHL